MQLISRFLKPDPSIANSYDQRNARTVVLLSAIYWVFTIVVGVLFLTLVPHKLFSHPVDLPVLSALVISFITFLLSSTRFFRTAAWILVGTNIMVSSFAIFYSNELYWIPAMFLPVGLLLSGLTQRIRETVAVFFISSLAMAVFVFRNELYIAESSYMLVTYLCTGGLILMFQRMHKQDSNLLKQEKSLVTQFMHANPDLIVIKNLELETIRTNAAFDNYLAHKSSRDEILLPSIESLCRNSLKGGSLHSIVLHVPCEKDAYYHILANPIRGDVEGHFSGVLCVVRDITKVKAAELNLVQQQEKALAAARLAELGEFAGSVAHEINNPLQVILASAQALHRRARKEGSVESSVIEKSTVRIENTVEKIVRIVGGLRTFVRDGSLDAMEKCSVNEIVLLVADLCQHNLNVHSIKVEVFVEQDLYFTCREVQISQVLMNLINNSIYAISDAKEKWIRIEAKSSSEKQLEISVTDSGNGISTEVAQQIMQPFFTTKPVGEGTGLGLSISSTIIEQHKGKLLAMTRDGHTCFAINAPKHQTAIKLVS